MVFFSAFCIGVFYSMYHFKRNCRNSDRMSSDTIGMGSSSSNQKLWTGSKPMFFFCLSLCNEYMEQSDDWSLCPKRDDSRYVNAYLNYLTLLKNFIDLTQQYRYHYWQICMKVVFLRLIILIYCNINIEYRHDPDINNTFSNLKD